MPPHPKRDRIVIIYDLTCTNQEEIQNALLKIYSHNYFRNSKDLVNLVLVNYGRTRNILNEENGSGYENIYEVNREEMTYDPAFAYNALKNNHPGPGPSRWEEALRVALEILKRDNLPRIITYKILYLSDFSVSDVAAENVNNIIDEINENGIFLYIVGPQVKYPKAITSLDELESYKHDIFLERTNDALEEAKQAVINCDNAVMANVQVGVQLFFKYSNPIGKQPWTVPLSFGTKLQYDVETVKLMDKVKGLTLKKKNEGRKLPVFVSSEDSSKQYAEEDVRKGIMMHGKFIPLASNDIFKENLDRTFSVVFITKTNNIPEYMMKGPACYSVVSSSKQPSAAFDCLLLKLSELECSIIAKRVYRKGCQPIYLALIPMPSKKYFRAVELPFSHEIVFEYQELEPEKGGEISGEVIEFLDELTIGNPSLQSPQMTPNMVLSHQGGKLLHMATTKLLHNENLDLDQVTLDPFSTGISPDIGGGLRDKWPSRGELVPQVSEEQVESDEGDEFF